MPGIILNALQILTHRRTQRNHRRKVTVILLSPFSRGEKWSTKRLTRPQSDEYYTLNPNLGSIVSESVLTCCIKAVIKAVFFLRFF